MILIAIYGDIYEVSNFEKIHPGEGIKDTYLKYYKYKDCTSDFERYHFTNESDEMLINAKKLGYDDETGIHYVCPYFFKNKIPKYFHFLPNDKYGLKFMENKDPMTFILRRSNIDINNSLSLTYKDEESNVYQLKIRKTSDNIWYTNWENEDGDSEDVSDSNIENLIKKIMIDNDYNFN